MTGDPAYTAPGPQHLPGLRASADDIAAGHDAGVRLSLRVEAPGLHDAAHEDDAPVRFRAVLQVHGVSGAADVVDAVGLWSGSGPAREAFGPRAPANTLLALRRAARAWLPLTPLLSATAPDAVELADDEIAELLGEGARALAAVGVDVHWPRELSRELTAHAAVGPPVGEASTLPSFLSADALLTFRRRFALGGRELSRDELDQLAEAKRPLVRLRDRWVLVDPREAERARAREDRSIAPVEALAAALTGSAEVDGHRVEVGPTGWLTQLRERLSDPEAGQPVAQPSALSATLRDYQLRGLGWPARTTALGLGCCLADDMGLGKTVTLIFPVKSAC